MVKSGGEVCGREALCSNHQDSVRTWAPCMLASLDVGVLAAGTTVGGLQVRALPR